LLLETRRSKEIKAWAREIAAAAEMIPKRSTIGFFRLSKR